MTAPRLRSSVVSIRRFPARVLIRAIDIYRDYWSPTRMPTCRFTPTCSEYAVTALREWGFFRGLALTLVRLAKCGPWHAGGWDPVLDRHHESAQGDPQTESDHHSLVSSNEQRST